MNPALIVLIVVGTIAAVFVGFLVADYFSADSVKERDRKKRRRERRKMRQVSKSAHARLEAEEEEEEARETSTRHTEA
jgi:FtsZ-interacting cell division protein ZipA